MASLLFTVGGTVVNALDFSFALFCIECTSFAFSMLTDHGGEESKDMI